MKDVDADWINSQLRENFSCVLHHTDPKLVPLTSLEPHIQAALSGISTWQTGFVRRPFPPATLHRPANGLLFTIGGGGAFGAGLLKRWIKAAKAGALDLFPINVVCGPLTDADDRRDIHAEQSATITVHDWVANMDELIASSRAVVCMGGYNTLVEALSLEKPVLAFPNRAHGDQAFQVGVLHSLGMLLAGDPSQNDDEITASMNNLLSFRPRQKIDYNGGDRSVEIVKHLLDRQ